jgi:hypothetical protein
MHAAKKYIVFLVTLMMEALHASETTVLTRTIRRSISEDSIPHGTLMFVEKIIGIIIIFA